MSLKHALGFAALGVCFLGRTVYLARAGHHAPETELVAQVDTNTGEGDEAFVDLTVDEMANFKPTLFQRYMLAKLRAKIGVPTVTQANLESVRRQVYGLLREDCPDMRYTDLEFHTTRITTMAFVPDKNDVELSRMLNPDTSLWGTVKSWVWGTGPVRTRVDEFLRPRK